MTWIKRTTTVLPDYAWDDPNNFWDEAEIYWDTAGWIDTESPSVTIETESYLLINTTDYLLINSSGDKLISGIDSASIYTGRTKPTSNWINRTIPT